MVLENCSWCSFQESLIKLLRELHFSFCMSWLNAKKYKSTTFSLWVLTPTRYDLSRKYSNSLWCSPHIHCRLISEREFLFFPFHFIQLLWWVQISIWTVNYVSFLFSLPFAYLVSINVIRRSRIYTLNRIIQEFISYFCMNKLYGMETSSSSKRISSLLECLVCGRKLIINRVEMKKNTSSTCHGSGVFDLVSDNRHISMYFDMIFPLNEAKPIENFFRAKVRLFTL